MVKETRHLSLILFSFVLLLGVWTVVSFKRPSNGAIGLSVAYAAPLQVTRSSSGGVETFSGSIPLRTCDDLHTGVTGSYGDTPRVHLSFSTSRSKNNLCDTSSPVTAVPFSVTYASSKPGVPVLESVTMNDSAVVYAVDSLHY